MSKIPTRKAVKRAKPQVKKNKRTTTPHGNLKVFISWSGPLSKAFGECFKNLLRLMFNEKIEVFFSPDGIKKGEKWFDKISAELRRSDVCILVLTKDNMLSQWLNFEAGATAHNKSKDKLICPILVNIDKLDDGNPLKVYQTTNYEEKDIHKLFKQIHEKFKKRLKTPLQYFDDIFEKKFKVMKEEFDKLPLAIEDKSSYDISRLNTFPQEVARAKHGKVFLGAPMASAKDYVKSRDQVLKVKEAIEHHCKMMTVYYPGENIKTEAEFDGTQSAISIDFTELKSSEYCVFIYPDLLPSSILLEIGYAIGLHKKILLFTTEKKTLPFMLQEAENEIPGMKIYFYKDHKEIVEKFEREKERIFYKRL